MAKDGEAWCAAVHGVAKSWSWLSDWTTKPPEFPYWTAAAKSLQLCLTLCNPKDGSPPGFPVPGILQARTLEWVAISFSNAWKWKVKVKSLSHVRLLATLGLQPTRLIRHEIFQARVLEWGAIALSLTGLTWSNIMTAWLRTQLLNTPRAVYVRIYKFNKNVFISESDLRQSM